MAGVSLADIADLMGHKDLATTQIYAKVEQQHLRAVVSKLTPLISDDVPPKCATRGDLEEKQKPNFLLISGLGDAGEELAGRQGFEPRLSGPEPPVLPLNDLPERPELIVGKRVRTFKAKQGALRFAGTKTGTDASPTLLDRFLFRRPLRGSPFLPDFPLFLLHLFDLRPGVPQSDCPIEDR
jgi:hypothetical protein